MAGHIRTRTQKDGSRSYQARHPRPHGRPLVKTFERKRDAERWLAAQTTALAAGTWQDPAQTGKPFAWLAQQWRDTRAVHHAPRTRERSESILRTYLLPEFGNTPLNRMDRAAIKN